MYVRMYVRTYACMHACMHSRPQNTHINTHLLTHSQVDARAETYGRGSPRSPCHFRALGVSSHALLARPTLRICTLGTLGVSLQAPLCCCEISKNRPASTVEGWKPKPVCSNEHTNAFEKSPPSLLYAHTLSCPRQTIDVHKRRHAHTQMTRLFHAQSYLLIYPRHVQ